MYISDMQIYYLFCIRKCKFRKKGEFIKIRYTINSINNALKIFLRHVL